MILSPDKGQRIDGTVNRILESINSPIPLLGVTRMDNFVFNDSLLKLPSKYAIFDYCEYGANDWDRKETHLFGVNTDKFKYAFPGGEWDKFDQWVKENPPAVYYKRELLKKDASDFVVPIEYPCWGPKFQIQGKQEFINRKIELFHYWGWSHESRRVFHGKCWEHSAKTGIYVVDNLVYVNRVFNDADNKRLWVTINLPHFARVEMSDIYSVSFNSKLNLSLPGAGIKCFRHSEAPINSIMVMQEDPLAWSIEWQHGFNCIKVPIGDTMDDIRGLNGCPEIPAIENALQRTDLWKIYLEGINTCDKYRPENYLPNIEKSINERL